MNHLLLAINNRESSLIRYLRESQAGPPALIYSLSFYSSLTYFNYDASSGWNLRLHW
jgi:hypothetical protein